MGFEALTSLDEMMQQRDKSLVCWQIRPRSAVVLPHRLSARLLSRCQLPGARRVLKRMPSLMSLGCKNFGARLLTIFLRVLTPQVFLLH